MYDNNIHMCIFQLFGFSYYEASQMVISTPTPPLPLDYWGLKYGIGILVDRINYPFSSSYFHERKPRSVEYPVNNFITNQGYFSNIEA